MISFAKPEEDDLIRALSEAIAIVSKGQHDPIEAHQRVKNFYNWGEVAERTEIVYDAVIKSEQKDLWTRMKRTMELGPFAGPIYTIMLVVDCLFFLFLEWLMPRHDLDFVQMHWKHDNFRQVQ
jgi:phosphatidylinositol glycan class A protein